MKTKLYNLIYKVFIFIILIVSVIVWYLLLDYASKKLGVPIFDTSYYSNSSNKLDGIVMITLFFVITYGGIYLVERFAKWMDKIYSSKIKIHEQHSKQH
jgi:hypothetical protein